MTKAKKDEAKAAPIMPTEINLTLDRTSTLDSVIENVLRLVPEGGSVASVKLTEYSETERISNEGNKKPCKPFDFRADYMNNIILAVRKSKEPLLLSGNDYYNAMTGTVETAISLPVLTVPMSKNGIDFTGFDCSWRSKREIDKRIKKIKFNNERYTKTLSNFTGGKINELIRPETAAQLDVLKSASYIINADLNATKQSLMGMLYKYLAAREREVLLYRHRENVKWRHPHDEYILSAINEMIWLFNDNFPFENSKTPRGQESSFVRGHYE